MTLKSLRTDENFAYFYEKVNIFAKEHHFEEPAIPRKRKVFFGRVPYEYPNTLKPIQDEGTKYSPFRFFLSNF